MPISSEDFNVDFRFENTINQPVLFGYLTAPTSLRLPLQGFRMSRSGLWMVCQFIQQYKRFLKGTRFIPFQFAQIFFRTR